MFCAKCGQPMPEQARFCGACGEPAIAEAGAENFQATAGANPAQAVPAAAVAAAPVAATLASGPSGMPTSKSSGKALASMICGIAGFFLILPAIVAIILGHLSLGEIKRSLGRMTGKGMAIAGLVMGYFVAVLVPLTVAAVFLAMPALIKVRQQANAKAAIASLRYISTAESAYARQYPSLGYSANLADLGGATGATSAPTATRAQLVIDSAATADVTPISGYIFSYTPGPCCPVRTFKLTARPTGNAGMRYFYTDQTGAIRFNDDAAATAESPLIE